jgi:lysophospholipase L1-like esterase
MNIDASLPAQRTDDHFVERHEAFLQLIKEGPINLLFLGDSITRRWAEVPELWNLYYRKYQPANFGVGSDTTQNLLWRIQHGELDGIHPKVTVLLIGTNNVPTNSGSEIAAAIKKIIGVIQLKLPDTKIILLAIFPRGPETTPDNVSVPTRNYMEIINEANLELSKLENGDLIRFLDIGPLFLRSDGNINTSYLPDQLHLIEPGYKIWAEAMKNLLDEMM